MVRIDRLRFCFCVVMLRYVRRQCHTSSAEWLCNSMHPASGNPTWARMAVHSQRHPPATSVIGANSGMLQQCGREMRATVSWPSLLVNHHRKQQCFAAKIIRIMPMCASGASSLYPADSRRGQHHAYCPHTPSASHTQAIQSAILAQTNRDALQAQCVSVILIPQ